MMVYQLQLARRNGESLEWQTVTQRIEAQSHWAAAKKVGMPTTSRAETDIYYLELTTAQKRDGYVDARLVKGSDTLTE